MVPSIDVQDPKYRVSDKFAPDKSSAWKMPIEEDGWVHAHNSLRLEMSEIKDVLAELTIRGHIKEEWEIKAIKEIWNLHLEHVHSHHRNEDVIFVPFARTRYIYQEKLEDDHKELEERFRKLGNIFQSLKIGSKVNDLYVEWKNYEIMMIPHLKEEEETVLPLLRAYFTPQEFAPIIQDIMKDSSKMETGSFIYAMGVKKFRNEFMKNEGIPGFVWFVFFKASYKYFLMKFHRNIENLKAGKQIKNEYQDPCSIM